MQQGFSCSAGDVLQSAQGDALPECRELRETTKLETQQATVPCPPGSVNVNNTCRACPRGAYQDASGQVYGNFLRGTRSCLKIACKACPEGTWTLLEGSISPRDCLGKYGSIDQPRTDYCSYVRQRPVLCVWSRAVSAVPATHLLGAASRRYTVD